MHSHESFVFSAAASLLWATTTAASNNTSNLIFHYPGSAAPFGANMSISDDLLLRVDFSTKNSTPDSFASIGGGANDSLAHRDIYAYAGFHNAANISEYFLGDWDVKGSLQLSEGVSATVDVSAYWSFDRQPELDRVVSATGSNQSSYSYHINNTRKASPYCSGLDPGVRTFTIAYIEFRLKFQLNRTATAAPEAKGRIGEKSEQALSLSTQMTVRDGCSRTNAYCKKDRTGFELCYTYNKTEALRKEEFNREPAIQMLAPTYNIDPK